MKKNNLSPAIFIAGFSAANAQSNQSANQTVSLTVVNSGGITLRAALSGLSSANTLILKVV